MAFVPKKQAKQRELIPEDTHEGYCIGLVLTGTHERKPYKGVEKEPCQKIIIVFELTDLLHTYKEEEGPQPAWKSINYTFSFGDQSHLVKLLKPWLGDLEKVDWQDLPGTPCSIAIKWEAGSDGNIYDNITGLTSVSKKHLSSMSKRISDTFIYDIDEDGFKGKNWDSLKEWMQKEVMKSLEYQTFLEGGTEDDTPPFEA